MSYIAKISAKSPMAIVVMVDQSGSMSEPTLWNGVQTPKSVAVAEVINNILDEFIARARSESTYRHYYDIMTIGYSGAGVRSLISEGDSYFLTPSQLAGSVKRTQQIQRQRRLPDGRLIMTNVRQRVWIEPLADGRTPMKTAFTLVQQQLKRWCSKHTESFPPIVINITDGEATDASQEQIINAARDIKSVSTADGQALLMNVHLSRTSDSMVIFPSSKADIPQDRYAEQLLEMSSILPAPFQREIMAMYPDRNSTNSFYGMAFNASIADMVRFLNIGSTTINTVMTL